VSAVISILYNLVKIGRDFFSFLRQRNDDKRIKESYDEAKDAVKDGDVDKINEIIKR